MNLTLPWPPTANTYWRHPTKGKLAGRHLLSEMGRTYRQLVKVMLADQVQNGPITERIAVDIIAYPPDKRRRDLDNLHKGLLDSLTHAGVWADDSQIDDLRIRRATTLGGRVEVSITPMGAA